jgi:hypothetical protein
MEQALGWLRWAPDVFWSATLAELTAGVVGYLETRGVQRPNAKAAVYDALIDMVRQAKREGSG